MIEPWSHPDYATNREFVTGDQWPCVICGRGIARPDDAVWVGLNDGLDGFSLAAEGGAYPVGPTCYRKHRVALRPFIPAAS